MLFRKVFLSTAFLFVARLVFRALNAATVIFIARFLGIEKYGYFEAALAIVNILLVFNDLGMSTLLVKEASRDKSKLSVYFGNTLVVETVLSAVLYILMLVVAWFMYPHTQVFSLVAILGAANLIFEHRKVFRGSMRVVFRMASLGWIEILNGAANFAIIVLITRLTDPFTGIFRIAQAQLIINLIVVALFAVYALLIVRVRPRVDTAQIVPMIKGAYLFSLTQLFTMLYFSIDQLILSKMRPIEEVGLYSAPFKIIIFMIIVPQMIFQVIQPIMFRLAAQDLEKYKRIHFTVLRYLTAFGLPVGLICILFAEPIVITLFGPAYADSALPLRWFGGFIMLSFLGSAAEYSLTSLDKQKIKVIFQIITVGANITLDVILIHYYGISGPAMATFFVQFFLVGAFLVTDLRVLKESGIFLLQQIWKPIVSAAIMGVAIIILRTQMPWWLALICGGAIYLLSLLASRFLRHYDLQLLKQLLPKNKST